MAPTGKQVVPTVAAVPLLQTQAGALSFSEFKKLSLIWAITDTSNKAKQ